MVHLVLRFILYFIKQNRSPKIAPKHYNDVIMGTIASQITSLTIVYSIVSVADQRKHQSSASPAFVPGTGEFPAQMASYAENVSIWWRHHGLTTITLLVLRQQNSGRIGFISCSFKPYLLVSTCHQQQCYWVGRKKKDFVSPEAGFQLQLPYTISLLRNGRNYIHMYIFPPNNWACKALKECNVIYLFYIQL